MKANLIFKTWLFFLFLMQVTRLTIAQSETDKNTIALRKTCLETFTQLKPVFKDNSELGVPYSVYLLKHQKEWIMVVVDTAKFYSFRQMPKVDTLTPNSIFYDINLCKTLQIEPCEIVKKEVTLKDLEAPHYYVLGKKASNFYENFDEAEAGYNKYRGLFSKIMGLVGLAKGAKPPKAPEPKIKNPMAEIKKMKDQIAKLEKEKKELMAQVNPEKVAEEQEKNEGDKPAETNKGEDKKEGKAPNKVENKPTEATKGKEGEGKKEGEKNDANKATAQQKKGKKDKNNAKDTTKVVNTNNITIATTQPKDSLKTQNNSDAEEKISTPTKKMENPKIKAIIAQIDKIVVLIDQKQIPELMPKKQQILAQKAELQGLANEQKREVKIDEAKQAEEINKIVKNMQSILEQLEKTTDPELTSKKPELETKKKELEKDLEQKGNTENKLKKE